MTQFLRTTRHGRWHKKPGMDWLADDEIQGDALNDIRTHECSLSVYGVDSEASIERVVVALAASRDRVTNLDYVVFEDTNLPSLGITVLSTTGQTPDMLANSLHYDLGHLTADRLAGLAKIISGGKHKRVEKSIVKTMLREAADAGILDRTMIKDSILNTLQYD